MYNYNYNVNNLFKHELDLNNIQSVKFGIWDKISALTDVYSSINKKIGEINSILSDSQTSLIEYVVFQFEHELGLGEKNYFIPWNKFNVHNTRNAFFIPNDLSILRDAPSFHQNNWPEDAEGYMEDVDKYWINHLVLDPETINNLTNMEHIKNLNEKVPSATSTLTIN